MRDAISNANRRVEEAIDMLVDEKARLESLIVLIERKVDGLRTVLADTDSPQSLRGRKRNVQARQLEESRGSKPGRIPRPSDGPFAGLSVREAVERILEENPSLEPAEIRSMLQAGGYSLLAKSSLNTVANAAKSIKEGKMNGIGSPG